MSDPVTAIQAATDAVHATGALLDELTAFGPKVVGYCAMVCAFLPKPVAESGLWAKVYRYVNTVGFNFGHAANKS